MNSEIGVMISVMRNNWTTVRLLATLLMLLCGIIAQASITLAAPSVPAPDAAPLDALQAGKALQPPHQKAAIIRLHSEVDDMMLKSLQRRIDLARKAGCTLIVFDIDSWGGAVTSALEISKLIKHLPDEKIATVAWVNDKAYSAGSMISLACQQVVMNREATLGDCAPIAVRRGLFSDEIVPLSGAERDKMASPIIADFVDSAERNHFDKELIKAIVEPGIEIHEMHNSITGETKFVGNAEKDQLLAKEEAAPGGNKEHPWHFVETVNGPHQLLTVNDKLALKMGFSKATIENEAELKAALNITGEQIPLDFNWAEIATVWLTQWPVRGFLILMMLVLGYIEFSHPGISLPGIGAVICLILLVGAPFLTGFAQIWEIAVIILGLSIIVLDLVAFGGIGLLAIPGFILMLVGIIASFVPAEPGGGIIPHMQGTWDSLIWGLAVVTTACVASLAVFYVLSKYLYMTPGFRRLQLAPATGGSITFDESIRDAADRPAADAVFVGALGIAGTDLRPAGKGRFDDHLIDVVSFGQFIEKGDEIEVLEIFGNRIVVKPHKEPRPDSSTNAANRGETNT